jgi:hypothetical protein
VGIRIGSLRLRFRVLGSFGSSNPIGGAGTPTPGGGGGGSSSNPPAPVVKPPPAGSPPLPPQNNVLPRANGSATTGSTLTADPGTWTGTAPINFSFRWRRCNGIGTSCTNISGATGQTYLIKSADGGHTLRVAVTATNPVDTSTATSDPTALVPGPPPPPPPSGEVAHWSMESTGTMVDSIGGHDGTTHSISLTSGSSGSGYGLNGSSSYASVPSSTASDLDPGTQDFTVTIHMKPLGLPQAPDQDADIIRKGVYDNSPGEFKMEYYPNGKMLCGFKGSGATGYAEIGGTQNVPGNPVLAMGQWHTVQCIKTSTEIRLVVDGQTFKKSADIGSISNSQDLLIGAHSATSENFNGVLDEAGIKIG